MVYVRSITCLVGLLILSGCGKQGDDVKRTIRIATTTSTRDSGLMDLLIPEFEKRENLNVKLIAVGTGKALELGRQGEVDVLLVHSAKQELEFMAQNHGIRREAVMFNHFEILGPPADPANIRGKTAIDCLHTIRHSNSTFVSRGDNSGTHDREKELWNHLEALPQWEGFIETGQGMGPSLMIANQKKGYILCDRGTYLAMKSKIDLVPLANTKEHLENRYSVIAVNPQKNNKIKSRLADRFIEFMISSETGERIKSFQIEGEPLFHPLRSGKQNEDNSSDAVQ